MTESVSTSPAGERESDAALSGGRIEPNDFDRLPYTSAVLAESNGAGARWHSIYTLTPVGEGRTQVAIRVLARGTDAIGHRRRARLPRPIVGALLRRSPCRAVQARLTRSAHETAPMTYLARLFRAAAED